MTAKPKSETAVVIIRGLIRDALFYKGGRRERAFKFINSPTFLELCKMTELDGKVIRMKLNGGGKV